jgi:hypothetical protein
VRRFIEQQNSHTLLIAVTFSATISICGASSKQHRGCVKQLTSPVD